MDEEVKSINVVALNVLEDGLQAKTEKIQEANKNVKSEDVDPYYEGFIAGLHFATQFAAQNAVMVPTTAELETA